MRTPSPKTKVTHLDQKFWSGFAQNYWEKKPLHLKNVKSALLEMSDAAIFDLLVLYSDRCRKLKNPEGFKFYIDGMKAYDEDVLQILPVRKDKSLLGYHSRMEKVFSDYCLVCDELLKSNLQYQGLLTEFTDQLYRHVGFPNRFSEMGLYLGNYRKTPFGVHVDNCGVFSFPVAGAKKFRLWTPNYVKKNPGLNRAFNYERYKKESVLLSAGPGDLTYWPSSAWHIAESNGSFSATWSLGVWVDKPLKDSFSEALHGLLTKKLGNKGLAPMTAFKSLHSPSGEVQNLPESYLESIQVLKNLTTSELQETFLKSWMVHISQQGFKNVPLADFKVTLNSRIQLRNERAKILWQQSRTDKRKIFLSFGGILVESSQNGSLLRIIKAVNAGECAFVKEYLRGPTQRKDLKVLQALARVGAFA